MFEQDYIMRMIKEMIRAILLLLFHIDTDTPTTELLKSAEEKSTLKTILNMVDDGDINEAENKIFAMAEPGNIANLELILLFYSYLNDKSDDFLAEHHFSRKEIRDDLKFILSQYGFDGMAEMFLT